MARPKKQPQVEEIAAPDFALAVKIYREDIRPAQARVGDAAQEQSTAFKAIKKRAHIQPQAAKAVFGLVEMEESKRDDWLRSFSGLLKEFGIGIRRDLVDGAEGKSGEDPVVPVAERAKPKLVTIPKGPEGDADLNDGEPPSSATDRKIPPATRVE